MFKRNHVPIVSQSIFDRIAKVPLVYRITTDVSSEIPGQTNPNAGRHPDSCLLSTEIRLSCRLESDYQTEPRDNMELDTTWGRTGNPLA